MHIRMLFRCAMFCLSLALLCGAASAQPKSPAGYHVANQFKLGGEGGWDYLMVDSKARRLYVSRGTHVAVVNADTGELVGDIPDTAGVHGIAIAPDAGKGYVSDGRANAVTIFDVKTLKTLGQINVGKNPDAIMYDAASNRIFTFNGASGDATAIDVATDKVAGTIPLGGKPEAAAADGRGTVFVNIEDKSEIIAFDARKLVVKNHWPIAPGEEASGLALDRKHRRLFSVCSNKLMVVMDADNGHVITTLPIGNGSDGAAFDPDTELAFSSNGEGTLTVVHEDAANKFSVVENVPTQRGARTIALDERTHRIYLPTAQFGPPPAPTPERPRPRPSIVPGTFVVLVVERASR